MFLFDDYLFTVHNIQTLGGLSHAAALQVVIYFLAFGEGRGEAVNACCPVVIAEADELTGSVFARHLQISLAGGNGRATA